MLELISFGDPIYMSGVLRAISMMSNAGTFASLGAIGLLLGLLLMGIQGMGKGQIDLAGWGTSLVLFLVMFTITTEVVVIEKTPGWGRTAVRAPIVIDDVPIGVAVMGWFVSQTSYRLSQRMEQAFSIPSEGASAGSLLQGFGRTLEVLAVVREAQHPVIVGGSDRNLEYTTWRKSLVAYLSDCTAPKLAANPGMMTRLPVLEDPLSMEGVGYNSGAHRTTNYRAEAGPGGATEVVEADISCADQLGTLKARESAALEGYYQTVLSRVSPTGANTMQTVNDAYDVLGMTVTDAQRFVVAHILKGAAGEAAKRGANGHEFLLLAMVDDAANQRASQFAGEESMFLRMARPMIAFFETVVYIAAPFMALAVGFGRVGQGMLLKYGLLTVWVALWMPTLTALNLFSSQMAANAINATFNTAEVAARKAPGSLMGSEQILSKAEDWLGAAALLMASTPAITLMLVFGSAMTAVGLANRLQGADTINEKVPTPDGVGARAGIEVGSLGKAAAGMGFSAAAAPSYSLSTGNARSSGVQAASSELASTESGFTQTWGSRVASTLSSGFSAAAQRGNEARLGQLVAGTENAIASREVREALENLSTSDKASLFEYLGRQQASAEAGVGLTEMLKGLAGKVVPGGSSGGGQAVEGGASRGPVSAGFRIGGSADEVERQTNGQTAAQRAANVILAAMRNDSGIRGEVTNALAQTAMEIGRAEGGNKNEAINSAEFQESARALNQASSNYQQTVAASNTFGAQRSVDLAALGTAAGRSPETMAALEQAVQQFGGGASALKEANYRADNDFNHFGNAETRRAMAMIDQLAGNGSIQGPKENADERLQAISDVMGSTGFGGVAGGTLAGGAAGGIEATGPGGPRMTASQVEASVSENLNKVSPEEVRAAAAAQPTLDDGRLEAASGTDAQAVDAAGRSAAQLGQDPTNVQRGEQFNKGADRLELQSDKEREMIAAGSAETAVRNAAGDQESGLMDRVTWTMAPVSAGSLSEGGAIESDGAGIPNVGAYQAAAHAATGRPDDVKPEIAQVAGFIAAINADGGSSRLNSEQANEYENAVAHLNPEERLQAKAMAETMDRGPDGSSDMPVTNVATVAMSRIAEMPMSQTQEIIGTVGKDVGETAEVPRNDSDDHLPTHLLNKHK
jgi:hypothetical protein